jgi:putative two-component system response regulator
MADRKNKVLIIDDSSVHNVVLEGILEEEGYDIQFFNSNDPLEKIEQAPPGIILLDIMMPGRNGFDVLDTLKSNDKTVGIPVIMISAKSETDEITKAIDSGAVDYILKPIVAKRLIDKVKQYINRG